MNQISDWEEVPQFDGENAEAAYWADTGVAPRLMELALAQSGDGIESVTISLRMDPRMLSKKFRRAVHFFIVGTSSAAVGGVLFFFCRISRSYSSRFALSAR